MFEIECVTSEFIPKYLLFTCPAIVFVCCCCVMQLFDANAICEKDGWMNEVVVMSDS